jgi:hypothetical protein
VYGNGETICRVVDTLFVGGVSRDLRFVPREVFGDASVVVVVVVKGGVNVVRNDDVLPLLGEGVCPWLAFSEMKCVQRG